MYCIFLMLLGNSILLLLGNSILLLLRNSILPLMYSPWDIFPLSAAAEAQIQSYLCYSRSPLISLILDKIILQLHSVTPGNLSMVCETSASISSWDEATAWTWRRLLPVTL